MSFLVMVIHVTSNNTFFVIVRHRTMFGWSCTSFIVHDRRHRCFQQTYPDFCLLDESTQHIMYGGSQVREYARQTLRNPQNEKIIVDFAVSIIHLRRRADEKASLLRSGIIDEMGKEHSFSRHELCRQKALARPPRGGPLFFPWGVREHTN